MSNSRGIIVITGCCGRIGSRLTKRLCSDYDIIGIDFVPPTFEHHLKEFFKCDLSSDQSVQECFNKIAARFGNHLVSVVHLAAYYSFSKGKPEYYDAITVQGTRRILDNLKKFNVEQFIFSSTMLVHAPCKENEKINEESPIDPKWDYPLSKVKTEKIIHEHRGNIPAVILRIAGCYDDECHSIPISNQIQRIYEKQFAAHVYPGDLGHGSCFLHFDDLIDAFCLCIEKRKELPQEFVALLGEEVTYSYETLQKEISQLIASYPITTYRVPKWFAKMGAWMQDHIPFGPENFIKPWMIDLADDHYALDITRAKSVLKWAPRRHLKESLPKMIEILRKDPIKFYQSNNLALSPMVKKLEESLHG